jgi:hypothetical protein
MNLPTRGFLATLAALSSVALLAGAGSTASEGKAMHAKQERNVFKIQIQVEGTSITATLDKNETARDFVSLLPLTLTLEDYAATEKISDLPRRLSTKGAPPGTTPVAGDVTFYAPWGNLAIFHKDFRYSDGLIRLGKIDTGLEVLRRSGPVKATISLVVG